jgi:RNA polymerase sigma factor for flagellar operon FliA
MTSQETLNVTELTEQAATAPLWKAYKQKSCPVARDTLAERYMPLVRRIAKRAARLVPQAVDVEDMVAAGHLGLLDALESFEPDRGIRFSTFCSYRVRGAILDELRSLDWVPRAVRQNARQVDRATNRLSNQLSRRPTDVELSDELGVKGKAFSKMRRDAKPIDVVSIDGKNPNSGESAGSWSETLRDNQQETPVMAALRGELKDVICRSLSRSEKMIITLYYYEGLTMKEIGQTLNLSESRVSQVHASVLARLRDQLSHAGGPKVSGYEEFFKAA